MSMQERSMRSVFVGNIPYEATEEQLKEIFSEAGPVISFRLVYDRENGKPKGYGFCEYRDADTALSAMRNLNGFELNGRAIRVDTAASEKNKEELKNLQMSLSGPPTETPYGNECDPDRAPEVISNAVSSLPPEQMYELMKQMKQCIQNNPNEARNMLLQNPQLAYALLQAQVAMKVIDEKVASSMLHRPNAELKPIMPNTSNYEGPINHNHGPGPAVGNGPPGPMHMMPRNNFGDGPTFGGIGPSNPNANFNRGALLGPRPPSIGGPAGHFSESRGMSPREFDMRGDQRGDFDGRNIDPRNPRDGRDLRMEMDMHGPPMDPRSRISEPPRMLNRGPRDFDQRLGPPPFDQREPNPQDRPPFNVRSPQYDERQGPSLVGGGPVIPTVPQAARSSQDSEKAELIMQVLQLSDEQIALLPAEQRQSIMILKEQIARSSQNP